MKQKLLTLSFAFLTLFLSAQTDFRPGYIIKEPGDTLFGEVDYRGDLLMGSICKFRQNQDSPVLQFKPGEIYGYRFINSKFFISKEVKGSDVFLEFLIKGRVNIYYLRDEHGDHFYLDKEGVRLAEIPYNEGVIDKDGRSFWYESKLHQGILNFYMNDAPGLESRILALKKPDFHNLVKLAEDYHKIVCEGDQCIVYEKQQPILKVNLELIGGIIKYEELESYYNKGYFQTGVIAHMWMPRLNEKMFLRTGLQYSNWESETGRKTIFKIPFQFEYIFPDKTFSPKIAYGVNLFVPFNHSTALSGGVNINLKKSLYLAINSELDFISSEAFPLMPDKLLSYYISCGLYFEL